LKPEIHATYPLEQFREAMAEVSTRRSAGRVILRP
jgi:NADPH2:quinone reductase